VVSLWRADSIRYEASGGEWVEVPRTTQSGVYRGWHMGLWRWASHPSSNVQSAGQGRADVLFGILSEPLESPGVVDQNVNRNRCEMEASMDARQAAGSAWRRTCALGGRRRKRRKKQSRAMPQKQRLDAGNTGNAGTGSCSGWPFAGSATTRKDTAPPCRSSSTLLHAVRQSHAVEAYEERAAPAVCGHSLSGEEG